MIQCWPLYCQELTPDFVKGGRGEALGEGSQVTTMVGGFWYHEGWLCDINLVACDAVSNTTDQNNVKNITK